MGKLCVSMYFTAQCSPCIVVMLVAHTYTFAIDHVKQGRVEPPEPAPVKITDYEQHQGKPRCI
jgi:hypothetical protein